VGNRAGLRVPWTFSGLRPASALCNFFFGPGSDGHWDWGVVGNSTSLLTPGKLPQVLRNFALTRQMGTEIRVNEPRGKDCLTRGGKSRG
jgi:hypothetical protein